MNYILSVLVISVFFSIFTVICCFNKKNSIGCSKIGCENCSIEGCIKRFEKEDK